MDQSGQVTAESRLARPARKAVEAAVALALVLSVAGCGGSDTSQAPLDPASGSPVHVGGAPVAVAVGAGGVWVVDNTRGRVVRLNPGTERRIGSPIPIGPGPEAIAVGEGAAWVASGDDTVTRIDPSTGRTRQAKVEIADPAGIAAGQGSVWVTSAADATVTRIDPGTLRAVGDPIPVGNEPGDVAVGDGAAWVANTADGTVTRIDASSGEPADPIQVADYQVLGLCFGEDGVWVAKTDDRLAQTIEVVRVSPGSSSPDDRAAQVPAAIPVQLAAGDGGIWVTLVGGVRPPDLTARSGRVAVIDPSAGGAAAKPLRVGDRPSGIAVGEGGVWVANAGDGTVTRIDPGA